MIKLELAIEKKLEIMKEYKLTPEEFFYIELILLSNNGSTKEIEKFEHISGGLEKNIFRSLINKNVISNSISEDLKDGNKLNLRDIEFKSSFYNKYYKDASEIGDELFEMYPDYLEIDGKMFSARNITKSFKSMEEMFLIYGKKIKFDPLKHEEIKISLQWAIKNNLVRNGISDYITSEMWRSHIKSMNEGIVKESDKHNQLRRMSSASN